MSLLALLISSCSTSIQVVESNLKPLNFTAEAAPEWTALFERDSGWFGADGIFSIPLDGIDKYDEKRKKTLLIFSDTYIGEVVDNVPKSGNVMVNNTLAWLEGYHPIIENIKFTYNEKSGEPISYFVPNKSYTREKEYFWLGDGFVNHQIQNNLYIFAYHVHKTGPNVFDFDQREITILKIEEINEEGIKNAQQIHSEIGYVHPTHGRVYFGSGVFVNTKKGGAPNPDGYIYIYGLMGTNKSLIGARVKAKHFEDFSKWRYWDGSKWNVEKYSVAPITDAISNELSVSPTGDGRFLLVFQIFGISDKVGIQVGPSPIGPFGEIHEVYTCPEYEEGLLPYNAKAHHHLSKPGELIISYNTITLNFWEDIQKDASIYHPRFIKVKY